MRLVNIMCDGSEASFICKQVVSEDGNEQSANTEIERLEQSIKNSVGNVDQLI